VSQALQALACNAAACACAATGVAAAVCNRCPYVVPRLHGVCSSASKQCRWISFVDAMAYFGNLMMMMIVCLEHHTGDTGAVTYACQQQVRVYIATAPLTTIMLLLFQFKAVYKLWMCTCALLLLQL
jgi:hypothetical protein